MPTALAQMYETLDTHEQNQVFDFVRLLIERKNSSKENVDTASSLRGFFADSADEKLRELEKSAWSMAAEEKHGI